MLAKPQHLYIPNSRSRRRAVPLHDLHHVLTGYPTTFLGEAEIGAWELASGCRDCWAAWVLNAGAAAVGFLFLNPRAVVRAFARGRRTRNLYGRVVSDALLARSLTEVRVELGLS